MSAQFGNLFEESQFDVGQDAGYGIFQAGDGQLFALGIAHENWFWDRLCSATGVEMFQGLGILERRKRRQELVEKLQAIF